ncbi:MAG: YlxR family protein [Acidimicrobiaceae bacterium]|nr:YlxR family protein [Acidimicrobiaceae bacterium]
MSQNVAKEILRRRNPRTCVGCRAKRDRSELVRYYRSDQGRLARSGSGRGAWLCSGGDGCMDMAIKRGAFTRAFRSDVTLDFAAAFDG